VSQHGKKVSAFELKGLVMGPGQPFLQKYVHRIVVAQLLSSS
jgi:hypothetical protein